MSIQPGATNSPQDEATSEEQKGHATNKRHGLLIALSMVVVLTLLVYLNMG